MCSDFMFVDLPNTTLNLAIAFKKEYNGKFDAARTMGIVKNKMRSDFRTVMSTRSYYRYIRLAKMVLKHDIRHALVESQNVDDARSKCLGITHSDDAGLYKVTAAELQICIRAMISFLKKRNKPSLFTPSHCRALRRCFWWNWATLFFDLRTDSTSECIEF